MRSVLLSAFFLLTLAACERRNPQYCDGIDFKCGQGRKCDVGARTCVDLLVSPSVPCKRSMDCVEPDQPLCDEEAQLCRPCAAGEDSVCAARDAKTPLCLAPRCVECIAPATDSQEDSGCQKKRGGVQPICDAATNACRPCRLHRECVSGVCAKDSLSEGYGVPQGSCVPGEQVVVVDPSLCSSSGPVFCTPKQAIDALDRTRRFVIIRKSAREQDFSDIEIGRFENQGVDLTVIGPLSDGPPAMAPWPRVEIGAPGRRGFIVNRRSRVTIEGFLIRRADVGVQCFGDGPGTDTQVRVVRSLLAENRAALSIHDDCLLTLEQSWIGRGPRSGAFGALLGNDLAVDVTRADFEIRNTVFADNGDVGLDRFGGVRITGGLGGGAEGKRISSLVSSTLYGHNAWVTVGGARYTGLVCDVPLGGRLVIMNTLFFQDPKAPLYERYVTPNCGGQIWSAGSEDPSLATNMSVVLPRTEAPGFRDAAARDLHIGSATGAAGVSALWRRIQSGGVPVVRLGNQELRAPSVDMDGKARAQPGRVSIGAYEVEP